MKTGSETKLQGSIPCDNAGAWKPELALGISNESHSFVRGILNSMYSLMGLIKKGWVFDSLRNTQLLILLRPLLGI